MLSIRMLAQVYRRLPRQAQPPLATRFLSLSTPRRAFEFPNLGGDAAKAVQDSPVFKKIAQHSAALEAMQKFAGVMQKLEAGKQPGPLQMMKLVANSEFREASKTMAEEFKKAGVDLTSPDVVEEMKSIAKLFAPKGS
ncbi:hypothetical protein CPB83DRAFT_902355 [Crepidotus variabilis]|uniref:Uncharacterized protein n=1 Tax=Crepidotus variabilis TaxID=179855 RepID=A0A9P6ETA9_9AGAR|nr:hypothetical protein CPB83DRAFT_902355 [Crepidotus variabilis]